LQALSPAAFSSLPDLSLGSVQEQETAILRYTRDLRGNATTTLDAEGKIGMWLVGGSRFGRFDAATDRPRVTANDYHLLGGVDYRFSPKIAVGAFAGYSKTNANLAPGGSRGDLKSKFVGGYATGAVGPAYIDAWGSYTDLDWSLRRVTAFGSFRDTTSASTNGRVLTGGASAGLSFDLSGFEIEPFAALRYADIQIDRFTEAGGISALSVGRFDRVSIRSNLGARVGAKFEVAGATVRPQVRGGWYHEFRDQPRTINAVFVASEIGTQFGFTTTPLNADYYNAGAALNIAGNGPLSLVLDYDAQFDLDREYHSFTVGVRLAL
jgi:outer membrane autotransporter protein